MIKFRKRRLTALVAVTLALLPGWAALTGWVTFPDWLAVLAMIYTTTILGVLALIAASALALGVVYLINWEVEYQLELARTTRAHRRNALRVQQARYRDAA
ncbi:hypothetical protein [Glutamicibacter ardleyensis]|uniref:Signal transduction histidine kinase n=1 Tax=Glutamicibacter ardleyensis TaxID=225894 RepID=A0ABQ2DG06_9MICC|nr:hypothetical protein [Glutamicibacter ardleyensis]GGJ55929.1 hypothetical protein GCM10007173_13480 [Glutamicibacter ardleyensis]